MRAVVFGIVTSIGLSLTFWGTVSLSRWLSERSAHRSSSAARPLPSGAAGLAGEWPILAAAAWAAAAAPEALQLGTEVGTIVKWHRWDEAFAPALAGAMLALSVAILIVRESSARMEAGRWGLAGLVEALLWAVLMAALVAALPTIENKAFAGRDAVAAVLLIAAGILATAEVLLGLGRLPSAGRRGHRQLRGPRTRPIRPGEVAVLIPAHNEEATLARCLGALARAMPLRNVYVGSDASSDRTVEIAREHGCNVADLRPNRGKAQVLQHLIDHFRIVERYRAVLLLDADSELDPDYLRRALPLFDDPRVVAVAGHVLTKWTPHALPQWPMFFVAYRMRLYRILQALLRYGQTWGPANVAYIVPGFASMYRTRVLPEIDITAPGLVIEDFNMTFELHRKRLGRIAYSPQVRCTSQDPRSLRDYVRQVMRWNLGFWQTVWRNGVWMSAFWLSLAIFIAEILVSSIFFLLLPAQVLLHALTGMPLWTVDVVAGEALRIDLLDVVLTILAVDFLMTAVVAAVERKPILLVYGLGFPLLRWLDAVLILSALVQLVYVRSDGRWKSPARA